MKNAKEIYKEKPFYITIPAKEIYDEDVPENILIQGIIDLYYVRNNGQVVLVDYKTDFVEQEDELIKKYKTQLDLYKKALEKSINKKVDEMIIYSLYLQKEIKI